MVENHCTSRGIVTARYCLSFVPLFNLVCSFQFVGLALSSNSYLQIWAKTTTYLNGIEKRTTTLNDMAMCTLRYNTVLCWYFSTLHGTYKTVVLFLVLLLHPLPKRKEKAESHCKFHIFHYIMVFPWLFWEVD